MDPNSHTEDQQQGIDHPPKPDNHAASAHEQGLINISGHVRIFDPLTQETLVENRE
jgi:hypothetical protein